MHKTKKTLTVAKRYWLSLIIEIFQLLLFASTVFICLYMLSFIIIVSKTSMEESHRRLHKNFCSFLSDIQKLKKEQDDIYCSQPFKGYLRQDSQKLSRKINSRASRETYKRETEGRAQYQRTSLKTKIQIDNIEGTIFKPHVCLF